MSLRGLEKSSVRLLVYSSVATALAACGQLGGDVAQVNINFRAPASTPALSTYSDAFEPKTETGLVSKNFCYFFNVTGPDLNDRDVPMEPDTCGHGSRAKGTMFGPFAYGEKAVLTLGTGSDRRIDLLGFKIPAGSNQFCKGALRFKTEGFGQNKRVIVRYDNVELDPEPAAGALPDPMKAIYIFSRSEELTLVPGTQTVDLDDVPWVEKKYQGQTKFYPSRYSCDNDGPANIIVEGGNTVNIVAETDLSELREVVLKNVGSVTASNMVLSMSSQQGIGFPASGDVAWSGVENRCGTSLAAGKTCTQLVHFYPNNLDPGTTGASTNFTVGYFDGSANITPKIVTVNASRLPATLSSYLPPSPVPFGGADASLLTAGDAIVTITNTSGVTATQMSVFFTVNPSNVFSFYGGAYPGTGGTCGSTLGPAASCTVKLKLYGNIANTYAGVLAITFDGTQQTNVNISGTITP